MEERLLTYLGMILMLAEAGLALHPDYEQVCMVNGVDKCQELFSGWESQARATTSKFYCEEGESMGWVASPYLRGYVEAYRATHDTYWLDRFVKSFNGAICRPDSYADNDCSPCRFTKETYDARFQPEWGWYEVSDWYSKDDKTRFDFIVGEGLTLRAAGGFIKVVYDDPVLHTRYKADADYYLNISTESLIPKWDRRNLFLPVQNGSGSAYLFQNHTGQLRESMTLPHNQMQEMAKAMIIFYNITGNEEYRQKVEDIMHFFKSKWYTSGAYLEWHYWDPAGPWDYGTDGNPEHWVNVDHTGGYSAIVADTVAKAYLAGIGVNDEEATDFLQAIRHKADTKSGWYVPDTYGLIDSSILSKTRDSLLANPSGWAARTEGIPTFIAMMRGNSTGTPCIPVSASDLQEEVQRWKIGSSSLASIMQVIRKWKSGC